MCGRCTGLVDPQCKYCKGWGFIVLRLVPEYEDKE